MKILVIGQCTLHWGRMEYGNIGNYYIIEPFFRELHRVFKSATMKTTFQMSADFCKAENVECLPMNYYYSWEKSDLDTAYRELSIATTFSTTKKLTDETPYIKEVLSSDLVIDFSGDIWGANADIVGPNRFIIGLIKDRVAQLLGKPTAMIAGSPGPFYQDSSLPFAQEVFANFTYVSNREPVSRQILSKFGFDVQRVIDSACPAFLFAPAPQESIYKYLVDSPLNEKKHPVVGFILCGWNLLKGPYSRTDWKDSELDQYKNALIYLVKKYGIKICLLSHSNGFELSPNFKLIKGRDFPLIKRFYDILQKTDIADDVYLFDGIYTPKETKAIIANFDMLISGRVHGAVAGLSQNVPTVIIDYGHEPKAHKLTGFAQVAGIEKYLANPANPEQIKEIIEECWINRAQIQTFLKQRNKDYIKPLIQKQFEDIKSLITSPPPKKKTFMMYHNIVYKSNSSSFDDILQHLTAVDKDYATELSIRTDINAYAHKLFEKADRIEAWENDVLIGLAAYYNNETDHTIYISNISVAKAFRSCGIASTLLNRIKEIIDLKQFAKITLEADESLVNFYKKNDFTIGKQLTNRSYEMEYYRRTGI